MFSWLPTDLHNPFFISEVLIPLLLIFVDVVSGIIAAIRHGSFQGKALKNFWGNDVFIYLIIIVVVYLIYNVSGSAIATMVASTFGLGTLGTSTATSIYQNLWEFLTPTEMAVVDSVGASLGYIDPGLPTAAPVDPIVPPPIAQATLSATSSPVVVASGTSSGLGAFVDQRILQTTGISPAVSPTQPPTFTQ